MKYVCLIGVPVAGYLFGSFCAWDFNAGNWSIEWRFTIAVASSFMTGMIYYAPTK